MNFKAFALTGRKVDCWFTQGECPGLGASAPSGREEGWLFLRIFFSYNLALSEKKCNFVGDIYLKEKIMATLTDVDAEAMRQRLVVKESLTQAFKELRAAEASGAELPDARKLFK